MQAKTMQWEDDDNYSSWIPPSSQFITGLHNFAICVVQCWYWFMFVFAYSLDQSGDGRTHLNEKFGYWYYV